MESEPVIASSARRHGISDEDTLHAWRHPITVWELVADEMEMFIGPDRSARILEVGVVYASDGTAVIVHAMKARSKFLR